MNRALNSESQATQPLADLRREVEHQFVVRFGTAPRWTVAAPGRVNLIGGHTDYNQGYVLPMAIERYLVLAAAPLQGVGKEEQASAVFYSTLLDDSVRVPVQGRIEPGPVHWANCLAGVMTGFLERGFRIPPFQAVVHSSVPLGGGLSSSAALEIATATLLEAVVGVSLTGVDKALLGQKAEHQFAGVPCGIMDQFSSVFGQEDTLLLLDCRTQALQAIPFASAEVTVLITNSKVKHQLSSGEYARRRHECETAARALGVSSLRDVTRGELEARRDRLDEIGFRRARHVITENERTIQAAQAIREREWETVGERMYASHESLRTDYDVSCPELDLLVELARGVGEVGGVYGSRMTGGGLGGCTVTLVKTDQAQAVARSIHSQYLEKTGIEPDLFASRPAPGAHVLRG
jgi:galactokinase